MDIDRREVAQEVLDDLPRAVLRSLARVLGESAASGSIWLWTLLWILTAAVAWGLLGAAVGCSLRLAGRGGVELLARSAAPVARLCGLFGMKRAEEFFALE